MNSPACVSKTTGARVPLKYEMFPPAYSHLPDSDGKSLVWQQSSAWQGKSTDAANFRAGGRQNLTAASAKS